MEELQNKENIREEFR